RQATPASSFHTSACARFKLSAKRTSASSSAMRMPTMTVPALAAEAARLPNHTHQHGPTAERIQPRQCPYYVAYTDEGTVRVDVRKSPQLVGQASSRGTRGYNQDRAEFRPLRIPGMVPDRRDKSSAQLMYLGVYDG
ncbi:hypothetical protein GGI23_007508, partial [Coemansia sp. RSA 2559]